MNPLITANAGWFVALVPLAFLAYLAPFLIAFERRHRYLWTIGAINLVLGWTGLGWFAALVWAVNKDVRSLADELPAPVPDALLEPRWKVEGSAESAESAPPAGNLKQCPYCAEHIRAQAIVCRYCGRDLPRNGERRSATDLDEHEARQLQKLLIDGPEGVEQERSLLDVFEYARLLEAEESAAIVDRARAAQPPGQPLPMGNGDDEEVAPWKTPPVLEPAEPDVLAAARVVFNR